MDEDKQHTSFLIHDDQMVFLTFCLQTNEERGELLTALIDAHFGRDVDEEQLGKQVRPIYKSIRWKHEEEDEKYKETCRKKSIAHRKNNTSNTSNTSDTSNTSNTSDDRRGCDRRG